MSATWDGQAAQKGGKLLLGAPLFAKTSDPRELAREARRQAGIREYVSVTFQIFRAVTFRERGQK